MVAPYHNQEPIITRVNRDDIRSYEVSTNEGQTPTITMEMIDGSTAIGLLMDTDERMFHVRVTRITTEQREMRQIGRADYGRVTLNDRIVGVATDVTFDTNTNFDINTFGAPTVLRGTSDTYRIYYQVFDKEKQKYGGTKHTGYNHWLDFLEGIRKHKNKSYKIVNLYSNKHHVTDEKKKRLLKLI